MKTISCTSAVSEVKKVLEIDGKKDDHYRDETSTTEDRREKDQDITDRVRINKHSKEHV